MTNQDKTSLTIFALIAATLAVTHQPWQYWAVAGVAAAGVAAVSWRTRRA
ncbi:hypothetical protein [Rhodococcus sp. RCBS9]|nr:hypothetical protein [Rhodococcus sp. RCBS9]MDZ7915244.1 hypothetical protein [Rhodococcus sp. (in: high G+C Gram-positive bacteria)]WEX03788.1 hypothetical protein P0M12_29985 [Rhodococcus sp. RCBS9]WEX03866.1 hypothetical protein P0M12_30395 [Rhodococcus sp. RCBS9]